MGHSGKRICMCPLTISRHQRAAKSIMTEDMKLPCGNTVAYWSSNTKQLVRGQMTRAQLNGKRKMAGRNINPEAAELTGSWGYIVDPYGDVPNLSDEDRCIGRLYFAGRQIMTCGSFSTICLTTLEMHYGRRWRNSPGQLQSGEEGRFECKRRDLILHRNSWRRRC